MNRRFPLLHLLVGVLLLSSAPSGFAQVPGILSYQGRVSVDGVAFSGSGQFKFALVNASGSTTFWSNNGSSTGGSEPTASVAVAVDAGLYSVLLGDTTLAGMTTIPPTVFANPDVRLRVWFNDGVNGFQRLQPDTRVAASGYALVAASLSGGVPSAATTAEIEAGTDNSKFITPAGLKQAALEIRDLLIADPPSVASNQIAWQVEGVPNVTSVPDRLTASGGGGWSLVTGATDFGRPGQEVTSGPYVGKREVDATTTFGYNRLPEGGLNPNGDLSWGWGLESRYLDAMSGLSSEFYLDFTSRDTGGGAYVSVRPYQINQFHPDSGRNANETHHLFNAELFLIQGAASRTPTIGGGTSVPSANNVTLNLKAGTANWGSLAHAFGPVTFQDSVTMGGGGFATTPFNIRTTAASPFIIQSVGTGIVDAVQRVAALSTSGGDAVTQYYRTGSGAERMEVGAHGGDGTSLFGNAYGAFYIDVVTAGAQRALFHRFSTDGGATRASSLAISQYGLSFSGNQGFASASGHGGSTGSIHFDGGLAPTSNPGAGILFYATPTALKSRTSTGIDRTLAGYESPVFTPAGTTGAATIASNAGSVNFAAGATSLVVTSSRVSANSIIVATVAANDATLKSVAVVAAAGSFTLHANAPATAETRVNFWVLN